MKRSPDFPHLYWISFASETGWLGGLVAQAASFEEALDETWRRGLNPGGSVQATEVDEMLPGTELWRLYDRETLEAIGGGAAPVKWDVGK